MRRGIFSTSFVAACGITSLLLLAACSGDSSAHQGDDGEPLEVWSRSGPEAAASYEALFEKFTEETGIEVDYLATVEFETQLQSRAAAKDLPDVMIYDQSSMAGYADQGFVLPIEPADIDGADELSSESWDSVTVADGTVYGIPFSRHTQMTFINKEWREELGFDQPTNHDELMELAEAFATEDPDGNGTDGDTYGMAVPGTTDRGFFTWWIASYLWQRGGDFVEGSEGEYSAAINNKESVEALEWVQQLFCEPNMVQPNALSNASATPFFAEGQAGIYQTGPYAFSDFDNSLGEDVYEVLPAPSGPDSSTTLTERTSIYFGASTNKPDKQQQLAEFLITEEAQELGMDSPGQPVVRLPVNESVNAAEVYDDERWDVVEEQFEDSELLPYDIDFTVSRQDIAEGLNSLYGDCNADVQQQMDDLAGIITEDLRSRDALK